MWRPTVLRCLIALNWTIAGVAASQVVYGHLHLWHNQSYRWAHEQLGRDAPGLGFGTEEHWRRSAALADEYKARTVVVAHSGWWGWWAAMVCGAATAVGLMAVFPGVAAVSRQSRADADPGTAPDPAR